MNVNLIKLNQLVKSSGGGSGGGGGSAASSVASVTSSLNPLSIGFGVLKGAVSAVGTVLGVMGSILGQVVGVATGLVKSLYSLGVATAISGTKLSEFYAAFEKLPVIGMAFGILSDVMRYQEQLLEFFQQIAVSGASFSGSLGLMKTAAARSYMSMQDFATIVKENSELFGQLGGNVMTSITKFVDIQNRMLGPRSQYANMMYGMGLTAKTAGDMLAQYMKAQSTVNKEDQESTEAIIKGTAEYARELNVLSQLTGANAKKMQQQADALQRDEAYRVYRTTLTGELASKQKAMIEMFTAFGATDLAEMYRDKYAGMFARTEDQANLITNAGQPLFDLLTKLKRMEDAGASLRELREAGTRGAVELGIITKANTAGFASFGPVMSKFMKSSVPLIELAQAQGGLTGLIKNEAAARKEQATAAKGSAAELERAQQGIRDFGASIMGLAATLIGPLIPTLNALAFGIVGLVNALVGSDGFKTAILGITNWFKSTASEMKVAYGKDGFVGAFKSLFNKSVDGISKVWDETKDVILPVVKSIFTGIMNFLEPWFKKALDASLDAITDFIYNKTDGKVGELSGNRKDREFAEKRLGPAFWEKIKESGVAAIGGTMAGMTYEKFLKTEMGRKLGAEWNAQRRQTELDAEYTGLGGRGAGVIPKPPEKRHSGTIGMTGSWWEKSNATLDVQEGEGVFTKAGVTEYAIQNGLAESIQQLNNMMALQVKYTREAVEYARKNVDATKNLDGNLFARA
jgi:hypothetical protein